MGTRGVDELRAYGVDKPQTVYDDNAYTITSTYHRAPALFSYTQFTRASQEILTVLPNII